MGVGAINALATTALHPQQLAFHKVREMPAGGGPTAIETTGDLTGITNPAIVYRQ